MMRKKTTVAPIKKIDISSRVLSRACTEEPRELVYRPLEKRLSLQALLRPESVDILSDIFELQHFRKLAQVSPNICSLCLSWIYPGNSYTLHDTIGGYD
jgi:hypothetical protein